MGICKIPALKTPWVVNKTFQNVISSVLQIFQHHLESKRQRESQEQRNKEPSSKRGEPHILIIKQTRLLMWHFWNIEYYQIWKWKKRLGNECKRGIAASFVAQDRIVVMPPQIKGLSSHFRQIEDKITKWWWKLKIRNSNKQKLVKR